MTARVSLTVKTQRSELETISNAVQTLGRQEEWSDALVFRVNLVLEELGVNIMDHGHDDGVHDIEIALISEGNTVIIEVTDDGRPFNPSTDAPPPDLDSPLEDRRVGGLGLHFVRSIVDELRYHREHGKNHLTLITRRA